MPEQRERKGGSDVALAELIRTRRDRLVAEWTAEIRTLSAAQELSRPVLVDHMPEILERIAEAVASVAVGARRALDEAPKQHALDRLARGFDLEQVIREYTTLRQCILGMWEREVGDAIAVSELRRLDAALDDSITESTVSFAHARERMLRAVNQIAEAALGTANLEVFLQRILRATLETSEAVDTVAIFLREDEVLRMRASVGIEDEIVLRMGEGFAGKIATEGQPIALRHAATDPLIAHPSIRAQGLRALYGIPLRHAHEVIGVACMGSRTAYEFSEEDQLLFRTMASRATSVIVQTELVMDLENTLADRDRLVWQLAEERSRLAQILHQLPTGVLIAEAPDAEISFVNRRCQEIAGHWLDPDVPVSQYRGWQLFHFDGRPYAPDETPRRRALRGEQVLDEFAIHRPDGTRVIARAHAAPLRDETGHIKSAVVAFDDVSAQKRYENMLRFLSEASRQLAESLEYEPTLAKIARLAVPGIADWFAVDIVRDGRITALLVAHADAEKTKLAQEYRERYPPDPQEPGGVPKVLRDGEPELYEDITDELLVAYARDADHLSMLRALGMRSMMIAPLRVRGAIVGAISFVADGSGRRFDRGDLEIAMGLADRAAMAMENARLFQAAETAIRWREDLLAVVSHDLRSPLASISMSAALLTAREPDPRAKKQLDVILRATRRMERLIGDLLDVASIQAGRLAVERKPQELAPIVAEAIELAQPLAVANRQTLASDVAVDGVHCNLDRDRVLQLFANLLGNAKKFSPAGSTITVRAQASDGEVVCSVADTGPGIPAEYVHHVFDPYWSAKHEKKEGVGLGLFISRGIVEAHGGRIWIEPRPGPGATVSFALPRADQSSSSSS